MKFRVSIMPRSDMPGTGAGGSGIGGALSEGKGTFGAPTGCFGNTSSGLVASSSSGNSGFGSSGLPGLGSLTGLLGGGKAG